MKTVQDKRETGTGELLFATASKGDDTTRPVIHLIPSNFTTAAAVVIVSCSSGHLGNQDPRSFMEVLRSCSVSSTSTTVSFSKMNTRFLLENPKLHSAPAWDGPKDDRIVQLRQEPRLPEAKWWSLQRPVEHDVALRMPVRRTRAYEGQPEKRAKKATRNEGNNSAVRCATNTCLRQTLRNSACCHSRVTVLYSALRRATLMKE